MYGLSIDPLNDNVFASACDDGRVLIFDIREPVGTGNYCNQRKYTEFIIIIII